MILLLLISLRNIQPQPIGVQIQLVLPSGLLQDRCNIPRVLDPSEIDVAATLLDGVTDEFGGAGFSLGAHDRGLFFLAGFVDDEGGTLSFLLRDLFCLDSGGKFGREGEVLGEMSVGFLSVRRGGWGKEGNGRLGKHRQGQY